MAAPLLNNQAEPRVSGFSIKTILLWASCLLIAFCLFVALLLLISYNVFRYLYQKAPDPIVSYQVNKTVEAAMPSWSSVEVAANEKIPVRLTKILEADIPFNQDVDVWVDNDFTVPLDATISVPIDQEIFVAADVPIEAEIPLEGVKVQTSLWGLKHISLPLYGTFPINITIPFKGPIHIKTNADVRVQQDVTVHVEKMFTFPLDLKAHVRLPIDDAFDVTIPEDVSVRMLFFTWIHPALCGELAAEIILHESRVYPASAIEPAAQTTASLLKGDGAPLPG